MLFSYVPSYEKDLNPGYSWFSEMDIATFAFTGDNWTKQNFVQNSKEASLTYGNEPKAQFTKYNNINCLVMTFITDFGRSGRSIEVSYYNIETLKKVKSNYKETQ